MNIGCQSSWNEKGRIWIAYEESLIVTNYLRGILYFIQEFGPQIRPSNPILGPNCKGFRIFTPGFHLGELK